MRLHDHLGQPSTQDGLWIGGLVGGAQHQPCGVVLSRLPYYIAGAEDVRLHGLAGTTLQQRQVFVCRDVEDHIGPGEAEHLLNPGLVPDVRDDNARAVQQRLAIKFELKRCASSRRSRSLNWTARRSATRLRLFRGHPYTGLTAIKALWEGFVVPFAWFMLSEVEKAVAALRPDVVASDQQALADALVAEWHGLPWGHAAPRDAQARPPVQEPSKGLEIWIRGRQTALAAEADLPPEAARDLIFSPYLTIIFPPGHSDGPMSRNSRRLRCTSAPRR